MHVYLIQYSVSVYECQPTVIGVSESGFNYIIDYYLAKGEWWKTVMFNYQCIH